MTPLHFDVAIIGGGLAGTLLARQLRRRLPALAIGLFERTTESSFKVGESTVEIASNYLIRRLGLSGYLYDRQLPKNGLRFFFDTPTRDAPLERMSEIGAHALPFHPSFQINRARLENDLRARNAADGVTVRLGARVRDLELGRDGGPHRFKVTSGGATDAYTSRWIVDASGRASTIARLESLRVAEPAHEIGAVWGRFTGVRDLDDETPPEFRARVRHSSRALSTVHFCYPGYWIWFIPLREGIVSVGVVGEQTLLAPAERSAESFRAFLDEHGAVRALLAGAEMLDVDAYKHLPYATRRYFSADRWGLTGEAAAFSDPFYSPGSDYIALENDFLTDLIARDCEGDDAGALRERTELYDRFMHFRHESAMRLYRGLYQTLGSYELLRLKWDFDIASYYNLWVDAYMQDRHLDAAFVERQLREAPYVLQTLANFAALFRKVEASLKTRGAFHRRNLGEHAEPLSAVPFVRDVGTPRTRAEIQARTLDLLNAIRRRALDLLDADADPRARQESLPLAGFVGDRALA